MYITTDTIITAATLIGALGVIGGTIVAIYKFYQKPAKLEKKLENLQKTHDEDIRKRLSSTPKKIEEYKRGTVSCHLRIVGMPERLERTGV